MPVFLGVDRTVDFNVAWGRVRVKFVEVRLGVERRALVTRDGCTRGPRLVEDRVEFILLVLLDRDRKAGAEVLERVLDRPAEREATLGAELRALLFDIEERVLRVARRPELLDLEPRIEREELDLELERRLAVRDFGPLGDASTTGTT